jgi:hypothetical protein
VGKEFNKDEECKPCQDNSELDMLQLINVHARTLVDQKKYQQNVLF